MSGDKLLDSIFLSCKSVLARVVSRVVPPHDVEDIVQETYVRACQFKSRGEIRDVQSFLVKTARNLALDHIKRAEYRLSSTCDFGDELHQLSIEDTLREPFRCQVSDEEFVQFCEAVRRLPLQCRKVFVLKKVYGHSQREVAKKLSLSESTVEKHVAKGLKSCAEHMKRYHEGKMSSPTKSMRMSKLGRNR